MRGVARSGVVQLGLSVVPFVIAGALIHPRHPPAGTCPAPGEGLTGCTLQHTWAAWLTLVALVGVGTHVVAWLGVYGIPSVVRRLRNGERVRRRRPAGPVADPVLAAATWSWVADPSARAAVETVRTVAAVKREIGPRPATVGAAICGRCSEIVPSVGFRCACPWCGGVAVRTSVVPPPRPPGAPRVPPRRPLGQASWPAVDRRRRSHAGTWPFAERRGAERERPSLVIRL